MFWFILTLRLRQISAPWQPSNWLGGPLNPLCHSDNVAEAEAGPARGHGCQRRDGRIARVCLRAHFSYVVAYHRATSGLRGTADILPDSVSYNTRSWLGRYSG